MAPAPHPPEPRTARPASASVDPGERGRAAPRAWRVFRDRLLGMRPSLEEFRPLIELTRAAHTRAPNNWAVPAFASLCAVGLILFNKIAFAPSDGVGAMIYRIFVLDYVLFFFGLVSGWNMARRWRGAASHVEELALTPLPPRAIAAVFTAGPVAIWLRVMVLVFFLDLLTPAHAIQVAIDSHGGLITLAVYLTVHVIVSALLAWFHYESARLAHFMFLKHALPRVSLLRAGVINFITMDMIVLTLSALGSIVTGVFFALLAFGLSLANSAEILRMGNPDLSMNWAAASIFGLLAVTGLKRQLCRSNETEFLRAWLQFQWWGAGEARQPVEYPPSYAKALRIWVIYHHMTEEEAANLPPKARYNTARYWRMLEKARRNATARQDGGASLIPPPPSMPPPPAYGG